MIYVMTNYIPAFVLLAISVVSFLIGLVKVKSVRVLLLLPLVTVSILIFSIFPVENLYSLILNIFLLIMQLFNVSRVRELRYSGNTPKIVFKNGLTLTLLSFIICLITGYKVLSYLPAPILILSPVFIFGIFSLDNIRKNLKTLKVTKAFSDDELPTVSVLIPARNEDSLLADCIESVIASDYPKLEVIVLDDCSQDGSSEIIKSFAQKGVRFIQGEQPKEHWLAKNQAYDVLAVSASGDWYLFMGVDVRLGKKSIRQLVTGAMENNLLMVGTLPKLHAHQFSEIFTPLRYFWELALPRFIMEHPPALSTCWVIESDTYKSIGGFSSVSQSVLPERNFAEVIDKKYKYAFCKSNDDMYVGTVKKYKEQIDMSERLLFPQLKKSVARLTLMCLLAGVSLLPYGFLFNAIYQRNYIFVMIAVMALTPALVSYFIVFIAQGMQYKIMRLALIPYLLFQELVLAFISAYRYEFSEVIWKGRNVCYPILKVIPRLPKI